MKTIYFASSNPEKIIEVGQLLGKLEINVIPAKIELNEPRSINQKLVAIEKAKEAFCQIGKPVIAEDTGVYFEAYDNFPGTFPAYMFGALGYDGLLALMKGKSNRRAHFKTIVAYYDGKTSKTFEGILRGKITLKKDSKKFQNPKLPYEAIFVPINSIRRLSRFTKIEKNRISHRGIAMRKFGKWFLNQK